jgi:hypothetical protein
MLQTRSQAGAVKDVESAEDVADEDAQDEDADYAQDIEDEADEVDEGEPDEDEDLDLLAENEKYEGEDLSESKEENGRRKRRRRRRRGSAKGPVAEVGSCTKGGRSIDGHCWHVALPATSCEETCSEKDLQYDAATNLGETEKKPSEETQKKCLAVAAGLGFKGKLSRLSSWASGCGCVVYKIPAYGLGDEVRLNSGITNAECAKTSTISGRLCACKAGVSVGGKCEKSSQCAGGYCASGTCKALAADGATCTEHAACKSSYCDTKRGKCSTLEWSTKKGAFAVGHRPSGSKRLKPLKMPAGITWEAASKFSDGFCLGYYEKTTGCMISKGIKRAQTIAKAKERCAQNDECQSVWCCATGCPATTCYATKVEEPNLPKADCPDAPGSFRETKYPNTMYIKAQKVPSGPSPPKEDNSEKGEPVQPDKSGKCSLKTLPNKIFAQVSKASGAHIGMAKKMWGKKGFTCMSRSRKAWCHLGRGELKAHPKAISYQWSCEEEEENNSEQEEDNSEEEEVKEDQPDASFKLMKEKAICRHGRKRVKAGAKSAAQCSEIVRQEGGMGFLFVEGKTHCFHAPKFSECKKLRKSRAFSYYDVLLDVDEDELQQN